MCVQGKPTEAGQALTLKKYGEVDAVDAVDIVPGTEVCVSADLQGKG
jgi:hypothetical protein